MSFRVYKHILPTNVCSTENFLSLPLSRNFAAKVIEISVGIFERSIPAPLKSFSRISHNFRRGISADWKIWEILGGDMTLVFFFTAMHLSKVSISPLHFESGYSNLHPITSRYAEMKMCNCCKCNYSCQN